MRVRFRVIGKNGKKAEALWERKGGSRKKVDGMLISGKIGDRLRPQKIVKNDDNVLPEFGWVS